MQFGDDNFVNKTKSKCLLNAKTTPIQTQQAKIQ